MPPCAAARAVRRGRARCLMCAAPPRCATPSPSRRFFFRLPPPFAVFISPPRWLRFRFFLAFAFSYCRGDAPRRVRCERPSAAMRRRFATRPECLIAASRQVPMPSHAHFARHYCLFLFARFSLLRSSLFVMFLFCLFADDAAFVAILFLCRRRCLLRHYRFIFARRPHAADAIARLFSFFDCCRRLRASDTLPFRRRRFLPRRHMPLRRRFCMRAEAAQQARAPLYAMPRYSLRAMLFCRR